MADVITRNDVADSRWRLTEISDMHVANQRKDSANNPAADMGEDSLGEVHKVHSNFSTSSPTDVPYRCACASLEISRAKVFARFPGLDAYGA